MSTKYDFHKWVNVFCNHVLHSGHALTLADLTYIQMRVSDNGFLVVNAYAGFSTACHFRKGYIEIFEADRTHYFAPLNPSEIAAVFFPDESPRFDDLRKHRTYNIWRQPELVSVLEL